ncbi:MAG: 50S ribosomal protein L24 [Candidatus Pacebacteria bacterium]|nr:50S ribosomal protein L24 [Candidatus Paceibacterota bacterium]
MNIKKGDTVKIIAGKDNGKEGKVLEIDNKNRRILVEGINIVKKHKRPTKQGEKGEIIKIPKSLNISNVMLKCPNCGKGVRVGHKLNGDQKIRYCKKCQAPIS